MISVPQSRLTLVSFRGPMGSGKTTAADILVNSYDFVRLSFATPLKKTAERITPDGRIDKLRDRALLQFLGTEYFRALDPNYWVKQWEKAVNERLELTRGECRIVVDDCRFDNERDAVHRLGGHEFFLDVHQETRANRLSERDGALQAGIAEHPSEKMLVGGAKIIKNYYGMGFLRATLADELAHLGDP